MVQKISAIKNPNNLLKRTTMAVMLAGAATLGVKATTNKVQEGNITAPAELVSKEAAKSIEAYTIPQQTKSSVPATQNQKLNNTLRKFIESEDDRKYIDNKIKTTYEKYGLFLGSAIIQHEIDIQMLNALMTGNTKILKRFNPEYAKTIEQIGPEFFKSITPNEDEVMDWATGKYSPVILNELAKNLNHKPTEKEVLERISNTIKKYGNFSSDEMIDYVVYTDNFDYHKLHKEKDNQSAADRIAYRMFMADRIMINKNLKSSPVFLDVHYKDKKMPFYEYIDKWLESSEPKGKY